MSREPFGPWYRPTVHTFDADAAYVMKTAAFTGGRQIGVTGIGTRMGNRDAGAPQFGGKVVFRHLIQAADGTLDIRFQAEMVPRAGSASPRAPTRLTEHAFAGPSQVRLQAYNGVEVAMLEGVPLNARITMVVRPEPDSAAFGLSLRGLGQLRSGYDLQCLPFERRVELFDRALAAVEGLGTAFTLETILKDDLIDVCVDQRRCIINRCPELRGDRLFFFALTAAAAFDAIEVRPLVASSET